MPEKAALDSFTVDFNEVVTIVEFFPHDWASSLVAVGTTSRVTIWNCQFSDESSNEERFQFNLLCDFNHGSRVTAITWSPETSLFTIPKLFRFCTSGTDKSLRLFSSERENDEYLLEGHTDYINDVTFDPEKGDHIASVSDDHTCRIWSVGKHENNKLAKQMSCYALQSPGMCVRWHPKDTLKLMVAEKQGILRFYNLVNEQPIMSLDCGQSPLLSADWCLGNIIHVAAACGPEILCFDTSRSSQPIERWQTNTAGNTHVRWCKSHDHLVASVESQGSQLRVMNSRTNQFALSKDMALIGGISWHNHHPVLAIGADQKVKLFVVNAQ